MMERPDNQCKYKKKAPFLHGAPLQSLIVVLTVSFHSKLTGGESGDFFETDAEVLGRIISYLVGHLIDLHFGLVEQFHGLPNPDRLQIIAEIDPLALPEQHRKIRGT